MKKLDYEQNTHNDLQMDSIETCLWLAAFILPVVPRILKNVRYMMNDIMDYGYDFSVKIGETNISLTNPATKTENTKPAPVV